MIGTDLTLMLSYDAERGEWSVGAVVKSDGVHELAAAEKCGGGATGAGVLCWAIRMVEVWMTPPLAVAPSESLHDVFASHP